MPKLDIINKEGKVTEAIELSDAVFGIEPNKVVMHMAIVNYLANQRQGTQSTKNRSEVRGGGRKPWRQKGTGHARQGSIRAPQWNHGGVALGPKPRDYSYSLTKRIRKLAMKSAFSSKVLSEELIILDELELKEYKTKQIAEILKNINVLGKALIVLPKTDRITTKSINNIAHVKPAYINTLNVYDILNYDKLIIIKDAIAKIEEVYV